MENWRFKLPGIFVPGPLIPPEREQVLDAFWFPAFLLQMVSLIRLANQCPN